MKERLKKITLTEAKENPQYWDVVKPMFKQQIARTLQHNFRIRHNKSYLGDFKETTRIGTKGLHFITEVEGKENDIKLEELTQKIKAGEWETLNFDDKHFIRNIYKALRLSKITTNEMATALLLHGTRFELREDKVNESGIITTHPSPIKKYLFEDKNGPYHPETITYVLPQNLTDFKNSLASLPKSEQYYFSLNFSHKRAVAFLHDGLNKDLYKNKKFKEILKQYINRFQITNSEEQAKWGITALNEDRLDQTSAQKLIELIEAKEPPRIINFVKRKYVYLVWETVIKNGRYTDYFREFKIPKEDQKHIEAYIKLNDYVTAGTKIESFMSKKEISESDLCERLICQYHLIPTAKDDFINRLNLYVSTYETAADRLKIFTKLINDLKNPNEKIVKKTAKKLLIYLKSSLSTYVSDYLDELAIQRQDRQSAELLTNISAVSEQDPWVEISPDYKSNDSNSPLLCEVLPTISAFTTLQTAMHGVDTTHPIFVAGQFTPRIIREFDEKCQSRPIETTHPDLVSTDDVHGATPPHDSLLTRHDLFHSWRNGAQKIKPFIRYLRNILEIEKEYDMSKSIWELSDMDLSGGRLYRQVEKHREERINLYGINSSTVKEIDDIIIDYKSGHLDRLLGLAGRQADKRGFFVGSDSYDDNLLIIVDMIIHQNQWKKLLGGVTPQFLLFPGRGDKDYGNDYKKFQEVYNKMERIAGSRSPYGQFQDIIFYILAYRLQSRPECFQNNDELQKIDLKNILHWERNSGLYFYPDFGFKNRIIEKLTPDQLSFQLNDIMSAIAKYSTISTKQSKIFCILAYRLKDHPNTHEIRDLLGKIDLNKLFKFRSTDRKLYLRDSKTGLLTNNPLPSNDELYLLLTKEAIQKSQSLESKEMKISKSTPSCKIKVREEKKKDTTTYPSSFERKKTLFYPTTEMPKMPVFDAKEKLVFDDSIELQALPDKRPSKNYR